MPFAGAPTLDAVLVHIADRCLGAAAFAMYAVVVRRFAGVSTTTGLPAVTFVARSDGVGSRLGLRVQNGPQGEGSRLLSSRPVWQPGPVVVVSSYGLGAGPSTL